MRPAYRIGLAAAILAGAFGSQTASAQDYEEGYDCPPPRRAATRSGGAGSALGQRWTELRRCSAGPERPQPILPLPGLQAPRAAASATCPSPRSARRRPAVGRVVP